PLPEGEDLMSVRTPCAVIVVLGLFLITTAFSTAAEPPAGALRIGLSGTLLRGIPEPLALAVTQPMGPVIEARTGRKAEFRVVAEQTQLGDQLADGRVDLAVFQGFELSWARQKYPRLCPLVIAVNQQALLFAHVLVRTDSPIADFAGLQDRSLARSRDSREH